jgi:hypothetical protein
LAAIENLQAKEDNSSLGRMKPSRGHQLDGAFISRFFSLISAKLTNATTIPPYIVFIRSCDLLLFSFLNSGLVRVFKMIGRLGAFVKRSIAHHGVNDSQQSSAHGDVGLGLSNSFDQSLPDSFLPGVRAAQGNGGLTESPSESGRTGLGDIAGLRSSGGFFVVGRQSCPELQGIGIGESVKGADLGGNDAGPDVGDTWYALENSDGCGEFFTTVSQDDLSPERFSLTLNERNDVNEVGKGFPLDIFEQISAGKEPLLSGGSFEFRAVNISPMEYRFHTVFGSAERFTELPPVSAEFSQLHQGFIGDEPKRTISSDQPNGNIERIVSVVFPAFSSSAGQFGRVGDIDSFDTVSVSVNEPFDKGNRFDSHPSWLGQRVEPVFDFVDTLGVDSQRTDNVFITIDRSERDSGFVQVDSDKRSEIDAGYIPAFGNSFTLFCLSVFHNKLLKKRFVK